MMVNVLNWNVMDVPCERSLCSFIIVKDDAFICGGMHRSQLLPWDLFKLNLRNYMWERVTVSGDIPIPAYAMEMVVVEI